MHPRTFSETRWSQYQYGVYRAFLADYGLFHIHAGRELQSDRDDEPVNPDDVDNAKWLVAILRSPDFLIVVSGLADISKVMGITSQSFQKEDRLPWNANRDVTLLIISLEDLRSHIIFETQPSKEKWPHLTEAREALLNEGSYQGVPLVLNDDSATSLRSGSRTGVATSMEQQVEISLEKIERFLRLLIEEVKKRFINISDGVRGIESTGAQWVVPLETAMSFKRLYLAAIHQEVPNFDHGEPNHDEKHAFATLMKLELPQTQTEGSSAIIAKLQQQHHTLFNTVTEMLRTRLQELTAARSPKYISESIWYSILTEEKLNNNITDLIKVVLPILIRPYK